MKKQLAAAALKYAGKKMAANAGKKLKKGVERVARAIKANPKRKPRAVRLNPAPRIVVKPLRVTLTAAEVKSWKADGAGFVAKLLAHAAQQSAEWDHIEARGPGGRHLFDVVP